MIFVPRCENCKCNLDNVEHVFLNCPYASTLWKWLFATFHITISVPQNLSILWRDICKVHLSPQIFNLWISACLLAFHLIWESRNQATFYQQKPIISRTLQHLKGWLNDLSHLMQGCMRNSLEDLSILKKLGINGKCSTSPKILEVNWVPPHFQWVKINTYGMALGSPGMAAIGGICRNNRGFAKGCFCKNIGIHNAFFAELLAFITAVELAWSRNWKHVWFELDSLAVVNCIHNKSFKPPWQLINEWANCNFILQQMQHHVSHVYREGNQAADALSKMGLKHTDLKWWDSYPSQLDSILAHDYASLPNYRFKS